MSEKELAHSIIDNLPNYKMAYALGFLQGLAFEETADDAFCSALYESYLADPDPEKTHGEPLDALKKQWGIA